MTDGRREGVQREGGERERGKKRISSWKKQRGGNGRLKVILT